MGTLENDEKTAADKFEALGICRQLAEAAAALKWSAPSPIQEQAVPHLLQGPLPPASRCSVKPRQCAAPPRPACLLGLLEMKENKMRTFNLLLPPHYSQ